MNFKDLCHKHDTDKGNFDWFYENKFAPYRDKKLKILEIGVFYGHSLLMLDEYFGNSKIYGLDCDDLWRDELKGKGITVFQGMQSDIETLYRIYDEVGPLDIIIDDGSHLVEDIIGTYEFFKDKFKYLYIIEDTSLTLYGRHYELLKKDSFSYLRNLAKKNNSSLLQNRDFYEQYWSGKLRELDSGTAFPLKSITFYDNIVCIENDESLL